MLDVQEVQLFGPVGVSIGGADVGHTDEEGVTLTVPQTIAEAFAGKFGAIPVAKWLVGQKITAEFMLIQSVFADLEKVLPGSKVVVDGPDSKLTFGEVSGRKLTASELILTPFQTGQTPKFNLSIPQAVALGDFDVKYGQEFNKWTCKFEGLADEAGGTDRDFLFTFGDKAIAGDVTAPTVTSLLPVNGAPAESINVEPAAVISENLDPATVDTNSILLIKDPVGTQSKVAGAVTLVNAGAATQVKFKPTVALDAATKYLFVVNGRAADPSGNAVVPGFAEFTTA